MRSLIWIAPLACSAALAAETVSLPDSTAADRTSVAVTVYNQNLALVREVRNLKIDKSGIGTLRFMRKLLHLRGERGQFGFKLLAYLSWYRYAWRGQQSLDRR